MSWLERIFEQGRLNEADEVALKTLGFRIIYQNETTTCVGCEIGFSADSRLPAALALRLTFCWEAEGFHWEVGAQHGEDFNTFRIKYDMKKPVGPWLESWQDEVEGFEKLVPFGVVLEESLFKDGSIETAKDRSGPPIAINWHPDDPYTFKVTAAEWAELIRKGDHSYAELLNEMVILSRKPGLDSWAKTVLEAMITRLAEFPQGGDSPGTGSQDQP